VGWGHTTAQFQVQVWRGSESYDTAPSKGQSSVFEQETGDMQFPFSIDPAILRIPAPITLRGPCDVDFQFVLWISDPQSQVVKKGDNVTMTVAFHNRLKAFRLQWFFNGTKVDGATNATLQITNVSKAQAGVYAVSLADPCGSINSQDATLTVLDPVHLVPNSTVWADGQFGFALQSEPGTRADIQASTNLIEWTSLATLTNSSGVLSFTDTVSGLPRRFYRAR
jgi:hypothetical protein